MEEGGEEVRRRGSKNDRRYVRGRKDNRWREGDQRTVLAFF